MSQYEFHYILNLLEDDIKKELTHSLVSTANSVVQVKDWQFVSGECFMCI